MKLRINCRGSTMGQSAIWIDGVLYRNTDKIERIVSNVVN